MIELPKVTLITIDTTSEIDGTINALYTSMSGIKFGSIKLITTKEKIEQYHSQLESDGIDLEEPVEEIKNYNDYNHYVIYNLRHHVDTSHCLLVQPDGFVLFPEKWNDNWLEYDYIGATWPTVCLDDGVPSHFNVGNGGFSLRSKKLHTILQKDVNIIKNKDEDKAICQINRSYLEYVHGIKIAPQHIADRFSFEYLDWLERPIPKTFGGHNVNLKNTKRSAYLDIEV